MIRIITYYLLYFQILCVRNRNMYQYDSRKIKPGDTFIILPNGEKYISAAINNGAVNYIKMDRIELAHFASKYYENPSQKLVVIGVTGTNGKTTVTNLINQALNSQGYKSYVLGTINSPLTTPESWDVQALMAEHLANGGTHFVMEVSSHGIAQHRILGIDFAVKLLTNITQDHLDFHKTFENYQNTKLNFMEEGHGIKLYPEDYKKSVIDFPTSLLGDFNQDNLKAAKAVLTQLGFSDQDIIFSLSNAEAPPGRFEKVDKGQPFLVIVDYAHTPDGLENVCCTAKEIAQKQGVKLLLLFGCGGDRDRGKRPKMAAVALKYADYFIVTDDNPRTEDPEQIFNDILAGLANQTNYCAIHDRAVAIKTIIEKAAACDVVLITGKGHETYQIFKDKRIHFDDREQVRLVLS